MDIQMDSPKCKTHNSKISRIKWEKIFVTPGYMNIS